MKNRAENASHPINLKFHRFFQMNIMDREKFPDNRSMPWKGEKNPYKIWLSEIILQQTRVDQGLDYYLRFVKRFPSLKDLANASDTEIFKHWEGLGYYTRCKNLIHTARILNKEHNGIFPGDYESILNLKGIGPYTAAAISSFAFDLPYAVVDGNVYRVLSRFFGIAKPIDSNQGKKMFNQLAQDLIDKKQPGKYNQAIMDLGAVVCKPRQPLCNLCPVNHHCAARINGLIDQLPVKEKKITKKIRWMYYLHIEQDGNTYVRKRITNDIWQNLYEFVLFEKSNVIETGSFKDVEDIRRLLDTTSFKILEISKTFRHLLTHQTIFGQFIRIQLEKKAVVKGYQKITSNALKELPFPKMILNYLNLTSDSKINKKSAKPTATRKKTAAHI